MYCIRFLVYFEALAALFDLSVCAYKELFKDILRSLNAFFSCIKDLS